MFVAVGAGLIAWIFVIAATVDTGWLGVVGEYVTLAIPGVVSGVIAACRGRVGRQPGGEGQERSRPDGSARRVAIGAIRRSRDGRHDVYGFFGVLYSTSLWNGFQSVS